MSTAPVVSGEDPPIFADPFFARVIVGAPAALDEADLQLMLCLAASDRGRKRVEELLRSRDADGVMPRALRGRSADPDADEAQMPVVCGGPPTGSAPRWYVDVDDVGGAREATGHLVSLGRSRVAVSCGRLDTEAGRAGYRGHRDAMPGAGLDPFPPREGDVTERSGTAAMAALFAEHPDADGVFAADDSMAVGAPRTVREAGRRVPADAAVAGLDDLTATQIADPPRAAVHQPITVLGGERARTLVAPVNGQDPIPLVRPTRPAVRAGA